MVEGVVWFFNNNNSYPPIWEAGSLTKEPIFIIAIVYLLYWIYVYYRQHLQCKYSLIVGLCSSLLFLFIFYYLSMASYGITSTTDTRDWYYYKTVNYDAIIDFKKLENYKNIDFKKDNGYVISNKNFEKFKEKNKVKYMNQYTGADKDLKPNVNTDLHQYMDKILWDRSDAAVFQGYCLITILFTILSVIWRMNKKLFRRLFSLFIESLAISVPPAFLSHWFYNTKYNLLASNIKTSTIFLGLSITLAIITELICLNSLPY